VIDERACIHPTAKLAEGVTVGPWTVIGADVEIGAGTEIASHVVIQGPTKIGKNNRIYQFASIGDDSQDKKFQDEVSRLEIGDGNTIREYVTINRGTSTTRVGDNNWIMAYCHIAHDCIVGNSTIFSNNASLAGHVIVGDHVVFSGFSGIHQFCQIGDYSFIAKGTLVTKDVLPYLMIAGGNEATTAGLNAVGLKRHGFDEQALLDLRRAYKVIFRKGLTTQDALAELESLRKSNPHVDKLANALVESTRGVIR